MPSIPSSISDLIIIRPSYEHFTIYLVILFAALELYFLVCQGFFLF